MSEEIESCPSCGALPCDWVDNPPSPSLHREPIEADREAMIAYEALSAVPLAPRFVEEIRAGKHDNTARIQAFMRHRLAFSPPAASDAEAVERVARAVWDLQRNDLDKCDMELEDVGNHYDTYDMARAAIRVFSLPKAGEGEA